MHIKQKYSRLRFSAAVGMAVFCVVALASLFVPGKAVAGDCWLAEKKTGYSRLLGCICDDSSMAAKTKMSLQGYTIVSGPMPLNTCQQRRAASFEGYTDCYLGKKSINGRLDYQCFCSDSVFGGAYKMQQAGYWREAGPVNQNICALRAAKLKAAAAAGGGGGGGGGGGAGGGAGAGSAPPMGGGFWQMVQIIGKARPPSKHQCYPEKSSGGEGAAYFSCRTVCIKPPGRFGGVARWQRPPATLYPNKPFPITLTVTRMATDTRFGLGLRIGAGIEPVDVPCGFTKGGPSMLVEVGSRSPSATAQKTQQFKMPDGGDKPKNLALIYCADRWSQQYVYQWVPKGQKGPSVNLPPMPPDPGPGGHDMTAGGGAGGAGAAGGGHEPYTTVPGRESGEKLIWSLDNKGGVQNQARNPTMMVLKRKYLVTRISTYHYNHGKGDTPGTISLSDNTGRVFGPWTPLSQNPDKSPAKLYWMVRPNLVLPAGTYRILDSNPATWSNNAASGQAGMTRVWGVPVD